MDSFLNSFNASAASFNRRENDIRNINAVGLENYNATKNAQNTQYNALKGQISAGNAAVKTQTGIEEGFAGVGMEPLVKSGLDYGAKSLYAAGKAAKAERLGTRAEAMAEGGEDAGENAGRGFTEMAADAMDSELAQNIATVAKAPGQLVSKAGEAVGDIGKAAYRGGKSALQAVRSRVAPQFRNRGDATEQEGTELEPVQPTEPATTETSFGGGEVAPARGNIPSENLTRNTTTETVTEDLPAQGGVRTGQAVEQRTLESVGREAETEGAGADVVEGDTAAGVSQATADAAGGAAAEAGAAGASAAADAATAATEAGIDAAAAASEAVPGVGTVVGGLLALGGAIFAGIEGSKHQSKTPPAPKPPPKPTPMGINISEAAPVMDSSIYRATGYNQLA